MFSRLFASFAVCTLLVVATLGTYSVTFADVGAPSAAPGPAAEPAAPAAAPALPKPSDDLTADEVVGNPSTTVSRFDAWRREGKIGLLIAAAILVLARLWLQFVAKPTGKPEPIGWRRYSIAIATAAVLVAGTTVDILAGPTKLDALLVVLPGALVMLLEARNPPRKAAATTATA